MKKVLMCFVTIIAILFVVGCFEDDADNVAKSQISSAYELTAAELYSEYSKNKKAADEKYKKKWMTISGEVVSTSNSLGMKNATLGAGSNGDDVVEIYFRDKDEFATIKKEQHITIIGRCDGKGITGIEINGAYFTEAGKASNDILGTWADSEGNVLARFNPNGWLCWEINRDGQCAEVDNNSARYELKGNTIEVKGVYDAYADEPEEYVRKWTFENGIILADGRKYTKRKN
ncbi:MAG: OB-fold putative lipoprotein [Chitinispirillales bacterium]|nr:OB-fold putative lipoprotein [Chitinispirillales bacterium]